MGESGWRKALRGFKLYVQSPLTAEDDGVVRPPVTPPDPSATSPSPDPLDSQPPIPTQSSSGVRPQVSTSGSGLSKQAEDTVTKLNLDGLLIIDGDDSNTNACLLAENFRQKKIKTQVIGCTKTIDGDLKCKEAPTSFGFNTTCKIYSEMIENVMIDARSTGKYYHYS